MEIKPEYRLLLIYDIQPNMQERYYRYVLREFVPQLQEMGLYMVAAWHTAYGDYPMRRIEFVTESREVLQTILTSDTWKELEDKLKNFTTNYSRKLLRFRDGYQM